MARPLTDSELLALVEVSESDGSVSELEDRTSNESEEESSEDDLVPVLANNPTTSNATVGSKDGRCPFKQYIPSKPAKYGVKIWTLCDSKTSYAYKLQIYTGKEAGSASEKNQGMRVVCDLTSDLRGHNVTCDNFFTSYNLGQFLLKRKITMIGTIRRNKPELPQLTNKEVHSSTFYFTQDTTIVNYIPKKNKNVVLMSTLHHDKAISDRADKKPQVILDYNATKGAVDTLDQLIGTYTCKRKTNRWPMTSINPNWNENKLTKRRLYLEELGKALVTPLITSRKFLPRREESRRLVRKSQASGSGSEAQSDIPCTSVTDMDWAALDGFHDANEACEFFYNNCTMLLIPVLSEQRNVTPATTHATVKDGECFTRS
ncbi:unnamed protein product [Acanthoscelides obtectus]|uniref:PiggyBac transposable element-derived protein domain-containing protein n=1 Tax=Acanthoscelides obtectus TaxID=200917 RepID=A0A9P0PW25_ACAOB|nr:unnamed protein product [Acanthoscelides obtectus]CAK1669496.1 PiggyBac transposable element-derived protein 4 [Acanthoscelides obtectus]